jgi:tRNA-specific 2-thiouridylase
MERADDSREACGNAARFVCREVSSAIRYNTPMRPDMTLTPKRVLLGLSGGVDSAAAAVKLVRAGWDVVSATVWTIGTVDEQAARSADALGLEHHVIDRREAFRTEVIEPFVAAWERGMTPNPCIACNPAIKFAALIELADRLGCEGVATGHYAKTKAGRLFRGSDRRRDQSYFLYRLPEATLQRLVLPLGDDTKEATRALVAAVDHPAAAKKDSQDICFLTGETLEAFLQSEGLPDRPGPFLDRAGRRLGTHRGYWRFTVGQRKLGQGFGRPMIVRAIRPGENAVILTDADDADITTLDVDDLVLHDPRDAMHADVQMRSQGRPLPATIEIAPDRTHARVTFDRPVRLTSPGQSAVFYEGAHVLGGGIVTDMA